MTDRRRHGLIMSSCLAVPRGLLPRKGRGSAARAARLATILAALLGASAPAGAAPVAVAVFGEGQIVRVADRPEMRSYQPYSGLQFGFRPEPPVQRGVATERPTIVMPKRLAPLIEYGTPSPYSAQWYAYCAERFQGLEPRTGRYTTYSGESRYCR